MKVWRPRWNTPRRKILTYPPFVVIPPLLPPSPHCPPDIRHMYIWLIIATSCPPMSLHSLSADIVGRVTVEKVSKFYLEDVSVYFPPGKLVTAHILRSVVSTSRHCSLRSWSIVFCNAVSMKSQHALGKYIYRKEFSLSTFQTEI